MFKQSLIQVFKGLAEFHGYVPVIPAAPTRPEQTSAAQQVKPLAKEPKPSTSASCC